MIPAESGQSLPMLVVLAGDDDLRAHLSRLSALLAETVSRDFGERAVVFSPPGGTPAEIAAAARAEAGAEALGCLVVDLSRLDRAVASEATQRIGEAEMAGLAGRLVHVTRHKRSPVSPPGFSMLRVDLGVARERAGGGRRAPAGVVGSVQTAKRFASMGYDRLGGQAIEPSGEPYPEARVSPEWCRLHLDPDALEGGRDLSPAARASVSRWARAVTHRRVAVALGGSGSWGYAHVALMQRLEEHGVPIDLVAGSSSGSLMGAYYAVLGARGLEQVVERGSWFSRMLWMATISSAAIDVAVDLDLGSPQLDELDVIFLPVAANLSRARPEMITGSTVGAGVRASSSAPGLFGATLTRSGVYVDGAIADNVPVVLLERMGADLLVACNPLPPPPPVTDDNPSTRLGDFLGEINPFTRLQHLGTAFEVMFHRFGRSEPGERRISYDPPPHAFPLLQTFRFDRAREILAMVKGEPEFQATVRRVVSAWKALSAPRARPVTPARRASETSDSSSSG